MKLKIQKVTLMEMIMVMLIIILLVTLILPVVVKGREWAKSLQCKSNLRSLGEAMRTYLYDSNDVPPPGTRSYITINQRYYNWVHALIDPSFVKYGAAIMGTPLNTIIKAPQNMPLGYIPVPKLKRTPTYCNGAGSWYFDTLRISPADYSSVLACPSQPIFWKNEYMTSVYGSSGAYVSTWYGAHYTLGSVLRYNGATNNYDRNTRGRKNLQKLAFFYDVHGCEMDNGAVSILGADNQYIYGRHFGNPMAVTPAWTSGMGYRYHGPGRQNTLMQDGHIESANWLEFYQRYPARGSYEVINSAGNPYYTVNW